MPKPKDDMQNTRDERSQRARGLIVSSAHLVSGKAAELSEFEFGLIIASHAFSRWMVRCIGACGLQELGALDVLVLHSVNHRERAKKVADICLVLNIEDTHTVTYALKKLVKLGVVDSHRKGKETFYQTTEKGREICRSYSEIREECLVNSLAAIGLEGKEMHEIAGFLRAISGLYDQAARSAASL